MELFFLTVCHYFPWLILGCVAGFMLMKRKGDKGLMLQAGGAMLTFALGIGKWLVVEIVVPSLFGREKVYSAGGIIFEFLIFVSLLIFVAGYCLERFLKNKTAVVSASPA